jgi:hypothetical protein
MPSCRAGLYGKTHRLASLPPVSPLPYPVRTSVVSDLGALSCRWNLRRTRSQLLPWMWRTPTTPVTGLTFQIYAVGVGRGGRGGQEEWQGRGHVRRQLR